MEDCNPLGTCYTRVLGLIRMEHLGGVQRGVEASAFRESVLLSSVTPNPSILYTMIGDRRFLYTRYDSK